MRLKKGEILVLRTCGPDGKSHGGFQWPDKGHVEAPDWVDDDNCGHGLHGLPWGAGGVGYVSVQGNNVWVVKVDTSKDYRHGAGELADKCKFRSGVVVLSHADIAEAAALIQKHAPHDVICNFASQKAGHRSTQTAGAYSMQKAGVGSTQTAGSFSTQTAGDLSTQTAGHDSTQTAGDDSTQTAEDGSMQKAGHRSTQTAGDDSTQTAGAYSMQKAGDDSTQTAGVDTVQIIRYYDGCKWKVKTRVITEKEADKPYKFENGDWRLVNG